MVAAMLLRAIDCEKARESVAVPPPGVGRDWYWEKPRESDVPAGICCCWSCEKLKESLAPVAGPAEVLNFDLRLELFRLSLVSAYLWAWTYEFPDILEAPNFEFAKFDKPLFPSFEA